MMKDSHTTIPINMIRTEIWFIIPTLMMTRVGKFFTNTSMYLINMVIRRKKNNCDSRTVPLSRAIAGGVEAVKERTKPPDKPVDLF